MNLRPYIVCVPLKGRKERRNRCRADYPSANNGVALKSRKTAGASRRGFREQRIKKIITQNASAVQRFFAIGGILWYNECMLSVLSSKKEGFRFYFVLKDGDKCFGGGLREDKFLVCDPACTEKELMLRTLINKCMNDFVPEVYAREDWGTDLTRFGFVRAGDVFRSSWEKLRLPHDCGGR